MKAVMENQQMWGMDLSQVPGFYEAAVKDLKLIRSQGTEAAYASCL